MHFKEFWLTSGPAGCAKTANQSGWIREEYFGGGVCKEEKNLTGNIRGSNNKNKKGKKKS